MLLSLCMGIVHAEFCQVPKAAEMSSTPREGRGPLGQHTDLIASAAVPCLSVLGQGVRVEEQLRVIWEVSSELL